MAQELRQAVGRQKSADRGHAQFHSLACRRNSAPQLVVVSQIVKKWFEAANRLQIIAPEGER